MGLMHRQHKLRKVEKATGEMSFEVTQPLLVAVSSCSLISPALQKKKKRPSTAF